MNRVKGKVAIVTGGAQGIGRTACLLLAREGAIVIVTDIADEDGKKLAEEIHSNGGTAEFQHLNVTDENEVKDVFAAVDAEFGRLDVLVNNAGISGVNKPTDTITEKEWDKVFGINVKGVFFCTKHAIPLMRKGSGGSVKGGAKLDQCGGVKVDQGSRQETWVCRGGGRLERRPAPPARRRV